MAERRDLVVNFERMRREMDDLFDDFWGRSRGPARRLSGFAPRVDVYYCEEGAEAKAIVKAELAGIDLDSVTIEVRGRELMIAGRRPISETEGRVYQQIEIPTGPFRRIVELRADVDSERASAGYEDGVLRIELPLRRTVAEGRQVPISREE